MPPGIPGYVSARDGVERLFKFLAGAPAQRGRIDARPRFQAGERWIGSVQPGQQLLVAGKLGGRFLGTAAGFALVFERARQAKQGNVGGMREYLADIAARTAPGQRGSLCKTMAGGERGGQAFAAHNPIDRQESPVGRISAGFIRTPGERNLVIAAAAPFDVRHTERCVDGHHCSGIRRQVVRHKAQNFRVAAEHAGCRQQAAVLDYRPSGAVAAAPRQVKTDKDRPIAGDKHAGFTRGQRQPSSRR